MSLVQSATGAGVTSFTLNGVSASNVLILLVTSNVMLSAPSGFSVASAPALYTANSESIGAQIFYNPSPSAGTNIVSGLNSETVGVLLEWSGLSPNPLDVAPTGVNNTWTSNGGSNTIASGVLFQAQEVVFAIVGGNESGAGFANIGITDPPTGFTSLFAQNNTTTNIACEVCYKVVSSTVSVTASWTWTDTSPWVTQAVMASFKLATLSAGVGNYGISGQIANLSFLTPSQLLLANSGTYNYIGAQSISDQSIAPVYGSYVLTGEAINLTNNLILSIALTSGFYALNGIGQTLNFSIGVPMPNFVGMEYLAAQSLLIQHGFKNTVPIEVQIMQGPNSTFGYVVAQSVLAGSTNYQPGQVVQLSVNVYRGDPVLAATQNAPIPYWYFLQ